MQKKILFKLILIIVMLNFIQIGNPRAFAEDTSDHKKYNSGISKGTIDPKLSFEEWEKINNYLTSNGNNSILPPSNNNIS